MIKFLQAAFGVALSFGSCASSLAQLPFTGFSPLVISGDGQEVTDTSSGLVWRRCAEGTRWDGNNCSGIATTHSYNEALGRVGRAIGFDNVSPSNNSSGDTSSKSSPPSNNTAWRLPTVYELSSITDRNRSNPTIDGAAFPNTPASWHWTSTFDTTNPSYIWIISFYNGYASNIGPYNKGYVRLVRGASQISSK